MADDIRIETETDPFLVGRTPTPVQPQRTWGEAFADTGKDLAAGTVDMLRGIAGTGEAVQRAINTTPPVAQRQRMDALADLSGSIRGSRSDSARYIDKEGGPSVWQEPGTYAAHVGTGIIPWLPLVPLGAWGAPVAGAIAYGTENSEERERIRSASPEEMANNSQYLSLIQSGLSDAEAREKLWEINSDPTKASTNLRRAPAVVGNALGFGAGAAAGKAALRGGASEMTTRIMNSVTGGGAFRAGAVGAGVGAATGYAQGAGTDWSRQGGEVAAGLRQERSVGQSLHAGLEPGFLFGGLGGAGHAIARSRQLARERRNAVTDVVDEAVPEIGTEQLAVAEANADKTPSTAGRPLEPEYRPPGADEYLPPSPEQQPFRAPGADEYLPPPGTERPTAPPPPSPPRPLEPEYRPPGADEYFPTPTSRPMAPPEERIVPPGEQPYRPPPGDEYLPPDKPLPTEPAPEPLPKTDLPEHRGVVMPREPLAPKFPEIEKPGLPRVEEFGEQPEAGMDPLARQQIDDPLSGKDPATGLQTMEPVAAAERNRMADIMQRAHDKGERIPTGHLPKAAQEPAKAALAKSPQGVIDAVRGDTERVPTNRLDPNHTAALDRLKGGLTERDLQLLGGQTRSLLTGKVNRIFRVQLSDTVRKVMAMMPEADRKAIDDAYRKYPHETVDYMAGVTHEPAQPQYRYKGSKVEGERIVKVAEENARRPERQPRPKGQEDTRPPHEQVEEALDEVSDQLPAPKAEEEPKTRGQMLREKLGLDKQPTTFSGKLGQHILRNVAESRLLGRLIGPKGEMIVRPRGDTRRGMLYKSLPPEQRMALDLLLKELDPDKQYTREQVIELASRSIRIAEHAHDSVAAGMKDWYSRQDEKKAKDAQRKQTARQKEEAVREAISRNVMSEPKLGIDTLADNFTVDPATGQRGGVATKGMTVRKLLEDLLDTGKWKNRDVDAVVPGDLSFDAPHAHIAAVAKKIIDLQTARLQLANQHMAAAAAGRKGKQMRWTIGNSRTGNYPWYDALVDSKNLIKNMQRRMEPVFVNGKPTGEYRIRQPATLTGFITSAYVLERAMTLGKPELWDAHVKEQTNIDINTIAARVEGLNKYIEAQNSYEDVISKLGEKTRRGVKLSEAEASSLKTASEKFDAKKRATRISDRDEEAKRLRSLQAMGEEKTIQPEDEGLLRTRKKVSYDFILDNELTDKDADLLRAALSRGELDMRQRRGAEPVAKGDTVIKKIDPTKLAERVEEITTETERLNAAIAAVPDDLAGKVRETGHALERARTGDPNATMRNPTTSKVLALRDELVARSEALLAEQHRILLDAKPEMMNADYGIGQILSAGSNLSLPANLPKGAYVRHVSDFLTPHIELPAGTKAATSRVRGEDVAKRVVNPRFIAGFGEDRYNILRRQALDVANKVVGDVEVVALPFHQMGEVLLRTGLPPEKEAFYDPKSHRIFIRQDVLLGERGNRVIGHEIIHPLTEVAMERFPDIANRIDNIRKALLQEFYRDYSKVGEILGHNGAAALLNKHEFMSEFFNDGGKLQAALAAFEPTAAERTSFGTNRPMAAMLSGKGLLGRMFDAVKSGVLRLYREFLIDTNKTALADTMVNTFDLFANVQSASDYAAKYHASRYLRPEGGEVRPMTGDDDWNRPPGVPKSRAEEAYDRTSKGMRDATDKAKFFWSRIDGRTGVALWGHDLAQMARRAEPAMQAVVEKVRLALAHSFKSAKRIMEESGAVKLAEEIADVMRRNPKAWARFENYYDYSNQSSVSGAEKIGEGRNKWISPTAVEHTQAREDHAILSAEYASMPAPMKQLLDRLRTFYDKRHDDMLTAQIERMVDLHKLAPNEVTRDALVKFVKDKKSISPAERADLEAKVKGFEYEYDRKNNTKENADFRQTMRTIREVGHLRNIPGVWFPKMRRGNWVVEGVFNLDRLAKDGVERERGEWEFDSEAKRDAFIKAMAADPVLKKIKFIEKSDPKAKDIEGEAPRWGAKYNPLMLEFHESHYDATVHHRDITGEYGDNIKMTHVEPRRVDKATYLTPVKADRALRAMQSSLKNSEGWADLDVTTQNRLQRNMEEAAFRHIMSTSARATYLPRTFALGSRKDVMRDFLEYSTNTSYSLGELRHRNELTAAYKELDEYTDKNKHVGSANDPQGTFGVLRRQIQQSLHRRADYVPDPVFGPWWTKPIARTLQLSYLDKLVSPTNWLLNATEQIITGAPLLAGFHGIRAYGALIKASNDMGWSRYLDGFRDANTVRKSGIGGVPDLPDNVARFKEATAHLSDAKAIHAMLDKLEEMGHLDRDSSMEMGRIFDPGASRALRTVDYVDNVTRQINAAIDNGNRVAVGIAALRLALSEGKGGGMSLKDAIAHAEKYVHKTTGNYAKYNEAEMFRHPALAPALQFKRYAQRMTANWLAAGYQSLWFGDVPVEQRWVARRQLAYMAGTVIAVSGTLGLPTEPIKGVINLFSPITGFNSDDAENWYRQRMAGMLGKDLGSIISNGIPRYLNVGIGTRLGLDSMWTYGAPSDRAGSLLTSVGHLVAGAPGGMLADMYEGTGDIAKAGMNFARGETTEGWNNLRHGATALFPLKALSDTIEHTATYINGPGGRTRYGTPQGYQTTGAETLMGIAGIRSGRSQERTDLNRAATRIKAKMNEGRNEAYDRYVNASSPAEKSAIWEGIRERYNKTYPEATITRADLLRAEQRHRKGLDVREDHPEYGGLTLSRRQRDSIVSRTSAYMTP